MLFRKEDTPPERVREVGTSPSPDDLIYHISQAYFSIRRNAMKDRQRRGLTDLEYAAMGILGREDGQSVAEIEASSRERGRHLGPDVIVGLAARNLVSVTEPVSADSIVRLTPAGRQAIIEIMAILKAGEAEALEGFDPSEVQLLKQLLRRLCGG